MSFFTVVFVKDLSLRDRPTNESEARARESVGGERRAPMARVFRRGILHLSLQRLTL